MRFLFHTEQWVPHPIAIVFSFFANPENLPKLMPAWQKARIEEISLVPPPHESAEPPPTTIVAGSGTRLTLSFRPFPFAPLRASWLAEIVDFVVNDHFCDIQLRGPFAYWKHCHQVRAVTKDDIAGTTIADHLEYELPFAALGRIAHRLIVRRQIESIFAYRQRQVARALAVGQR